MNNPDTTSIHGPDHAGPVVTPGNSQDAETDPCIAGLESIFADLEARLDALIETRLEYLEARRIAATRASSPKEDHMSLSLGEIESITNDYFAAAGGRAVDIYFRNSFLLDLLMNRQAGLFERPAGGETIRVPLDDPMAPKGLAASFNWKHAYGNATVYESDHKDSGDYAQVQYVTQKIETAQRTCAGWLAATLYSAAGDEAPTLTGLRALTSPDPDKPYGGIAENDLIAADGSKPWKGITLDDHEAISLHVLNETRDAATFKLTDHAGKTRAVRPNVAVTTSTLYQKVAAILMAQGRFVTDDNVAQAGFAHLVYEGMILAPDDYCPAGNLFAVNTNYLGFAINQNGFFARQPWVELGGPAGRAMKILWHGNLICSNRRAHACHSNLS
jgi:hypothetical protein